jgi:hypothetical protein
MPQLQRQEVLLSQRRNFADEDTPNFEPCKDTTSGDTSSNRMPQTDACDDDALDEHLSIEAILPTGDQMLPGRVKSCELDANGDPIGQANSNPILEKNMHDKWTRRATPLLQWMRSLTIKWTMEIVCFVEGWFHELGTSC